MIDGAAFFAAAKQAMLAARHQILLVGWDFDPRIELERPSTIPGWPNRLGDLLESLVETHPGLSVHVLRWQMPIPFGLRRVEMPLRLEDWLTPERLNYRLDGSHPPGAAHHQKILVIDDVLAFVGGIDFAGNRWDTSEHLDDDPRRVEPMGGHYEPRHDLAMAVDSDAAAALGDLVRERWRRATGELLPVPPPARRIWPAAVETACCDLAVGIARTDTGWPDHRPVREIERSFVQTIAAAREHIYIESQYLASRRVVRALRKRLRRRDGPEVVVVLPEQSPSWIEQAFMDGPRNLLLRRLYRYRRFHAYYPVTAGGDRIVVHSKLLIADDRWLRVGSANLNNRSLGFDTECDLTIGADAPWLATERETVRRFRNRLLAEHLGATPAAVEEAVARHGLIGAIERLRRHDGKTLVPLRPEATGAFDRLVAFYHLMDPVGRVDAWAPWGRHPKGRRVLARGLVVLGVVAVAALGLWTYRRLES